MTEDRIVKFCARVGPRSISLVITNCNPSDRGQGHTCDVLIFGKISVNISKTVQDRDIGWKTDRKSYMAYQMAAMAVILNDLESHSPVAGFFKCNASNILPSILHDFN